jgi:hypothetical protein
MKVIEERDLIKAAEPDRRRQKEATENGIMRNLIFLIAAIPLCCSTN